MNIADYILRIKMTFNEKDIVIFKPVNPKRLASNLRNAIRRRHLKWEVSVDRDSVVVTMKK